MGTRSQAVYTYSIRISLKLLCMQRCPQVPKMYFCMSATCAMDVTCTFVGCCLATKVYRQIAGYRRGVGDQGVG